MGEEVRVVAAAAVARVAAAMAVATAIGNGGTECKQLHRWC